MRFFLLEIASFSSSLVAGVDYEVALNHPKFLENSSKINREIKARIHQRLGKAGSVYTLMYAKQIAGDDPNRDYKCDIYRGSHD